MAYLHLGNPTKAIEYQKQWLAIAQSINDHQSEGQALSNLGVALFKSGNLTAKDGVYQVRSLWLQMVRMTDYSLPPKFSTWVSELNYQSTLISEDRLLATRP
jgi:hypothetical protein